MVFFRMNLSRFEKPSRYINRELNAIRKNGQVKVALAFPDVYEVGMSHLGLRILYAIINDLPYASAERVFSPWIDLEAEMKAKGIPLVSLETKRPLTEFDIVGFSLQYELSYTTVLNMLSLAGIPLRADQRDERYPLIISGGPCTVNPAPMAVFIDAFLVGDGEDAIQDVLETFHAWKTEGDRKRSSLLRSLSAVEGVYVPSVHRDSSAIKRRYVESLDDAPYPIAPVVPYTSIVHDRVTIELSRGCTMGCRFCQAGMIYRPLRERSPEKVLEIAEASLRSTGHEEISLTSLSAGDYSSLLPLVKEMNRRFAHKMVSLSLPSLRVAAVDREVLREIKTVRKTGFTMAPEAATARLRAVINKDFCEEDYERALNALFAEGWENIKLYFMVGLPTETDEDVEAIPGMALRAIKTAKKYSRRYVNVNVGVSPFVPKAHTPMQWCGQEAMDSIRAKMGHLRQRLSRKGMNFKGHNVEMSLLEAVLSRGDRTVAGLLEKAWSEGCRLDAWTEAFDFRKWLAAAESAGIDLHGYAERRFERDDALPWDGIDTGVKREFLQREFKKAHACEITTDCRKACSCCGLGCKEAQKSGSDEAGAGPRVCPETVTDAEQPGERRTLPFTPNPRVASALFPKIRVRVRFSKTGDLRYLSHRELMTAFIRAVRRADIPVAYSQGFHPSPRMSFGPPLNVGVSGLREYFDMEVRPGHGIIDRVGGLDGYLPDGLGIHDARLISPDETSLQSFISRYEYEIICPDSRVVDDFIGENSGTIGGANRPGGGVPEDLREMVEDITVLDHHTVRLMVADRSEKKVKLGEVIPGVFHLPVEELMVTRLYMFGWRGEWREPLDSPRDEAAIGNGTTDSMVRSGKSLDGEGE
jgi:radical SAM family uncharacterized protein/radical SAM-linked protein